MFRDWQHQQQEQEQQEQQLPSEQQQPLPSNQLLSKGLHTLVTYRQVAWQGVGCWVWSTDGGTLQC